PVPGRVQPAGHLRGLSVLGQAMKIRLYPHAFEGKVQEFEVDSLGEWLLGHYGTVLRVNLGIYAGEPSGESRIPNTPSAIMAAAAPVYTVLESPGAPLGVEFAQFLIGLAISVAVNAWNAPDSRGLTNRAQESPNNQLSGRENRVRAMERVEDIYGTVRSIPSMLMPTYVKYINHQKVEYGYYCVGRGYYDIDDV